MLPIPKNVFIDKQDNLVNKYNNKYQTTIKLKPVDGKSNTQFGFDVENNDKDPKCKNGDLVKITKDKQFFAKVDTSRRSFYD